MDPPHGRIGQYLSYCINAFFIQCRVEPGGQADLQVCICSTKEGSFSFDLFCQLENCDKTISLSISGKVEVCLIMVFNGCSNTQSMPSAV